MLMSVWNSSRGYRSSLIFAELNIGLKISERTAGNADIPAGNPVQTMYAMERFIQSAPLLILLTACAAISSVYPYVLILLSGLLMILFTVRSLSEQPHVLLPVLQLVLSAAFALLSMGVFSYMIFYEIRTEKSGPLRLFLPALSFLLMQSIYAQAAFPIVLFNALLLTILSCILSLFETCALQYIAAKKQFANAVSVTAVNEMYEKKLNKELVIKNYLADKNARLEERETISRNIHNSVGHSITAAIMTLDAADLLFDTKPEQAREKMRLANERIRGSLDSIRHAVRVLDSETQLIHIDDFIRELTSICDSFAMDTAIRIRSDFSSVGNSLLLPHEHTEFLTGAVQELLTNGVRHGNANLFTLCLSADSRHIKVSVSDNGKSDFSDDNRLEKIQNGFGLKKLISYTKRCGGTAEFENCNGFRSVITLPLYPEYEVTE